jgi:hypothetical protein
MIAKGLLERERSATDARANTVRLSEAGRMALVEGGKPASRSDARLLDLLSTKKRDAFLKTLATLAAAADAGGPVVKAPKGKPEKTAKPKAKAAKAAAPKKKAKKAKKQPKAAA